MAFFPSRPFALNQYEAVSAPAQSLQARSSSQRQSCVGTAAEVPFPTPVRPLKRSLPSLWSASKRIALSQQWSRGVLPSTDGNQKRSSVSSRGQLPAESLPCYTCFRPLRSAGKILTFGKHLEQPRIRVVEAGLLHRFLCYDERDICRSPRT